MTPTTSKASASHFPPHAEPRVWFITAAASPIGISTAREVLAHGDIVVAADDTVNSSKENPTRLNELAALSEDAESEGWQDRLKIINLVSRCRSICQAAVAEALEAFGRIDVLFCCCSEAVIGAVEELATSPETLTLIRNQFETNFFGPIDIIKTVLPTMRAKNSGHIMVLTDVTGHLGTPGLGMYCSAGWALEGFCDSLAYEIAPFNIRMTIIQTNLEISLLTNKITFAPSLPAYTPAQNPAPLVRTLVNSLLARLDRIPLSCDESATSTPSTTKSTSKSTKPPPSSVQQAMSIYPHLPPSMRSILLAETIHAITAIGGHENPPARHIVGFEAVGSVKEKLKTVSEELEDFVEVSNGVDIDEDGEDDEHDGGED